MATSFTHYHGYYIMDGEGHPIATDMAGWAKWLETADRVVWETKVFGATVSTVFLGLSHGYDVAADAPILWETMIFNDPANPSDDKYQERYSSHEAAMEGHMRAVEKLLKENL